MSRMICSPSLRSMTGERSSRSLPPRLGRFCAAAGASSDWAEIRKAAARAVMRGRMDMNGRELGNNARCYDTPRPATFNHPIFPKHPITMSQDQQAANALTHFDAAGQAHMVDVGGKA